MAYNPQYQGQQQPPPYGYNPSAVPPQQQQGQYYYQAPASGAQQYGGAPPTAHGQQQGQGYGYNQPVPPTAYGQGHGQQQQGQGYAYNQSAPPTGYGQAQGYGGQPAYGQQLAYGQSHQHQQPVYQQPAAAAQGDARYGNYQAHAHAQPAHAAKPAQPAREYEEYNTPSKNASDEHHDVDNSGRFEETRYRDWFWGLLFIVHLIGIIVMSFLLYKKYRNDKDEDVDGDTDTDGGSGPRFHINAKFWGLLGGCFAAAFGLAFFWLILIQKYARGLIWFTLILGIVLNFTVCILSFAAGQPIGGIIFLLLGLLNLLWVYLIRGRIPFATVIMEIVGEVSERFPATIYYCMLSLIFQGAWIFVWAIGASSALSALNRDGESTGLRNFVYFLLVISFFWTCQVIQNVVHVTSAGVLGTWYFLAPLNMPKNPTNKAFVRATTTSFGSICLGSLVVAIISAIRQLATNARRANNDFARACAECILSCIENLVQYFNRYAFVQVAVYGKSYVEAAKAAWSLLRSRGFDQIINDQIIDGVLQLATLMSAVFVGAAAALVAHYALDIEDWGLWFLIGALMGFALTLCAMEVVQSMVAALFVCFAEDPAALQSSKPEHFHRLSTAFHRHYPGVYNNRM